MELKLKTLFSLEDETIGVLYIDGEAKCFTLEDEMRNIKVAGETRIPEGEYEIEIRSEDSPMNQKYKEKFPDFFEGHLMLKDVPNFQYVYIHIGNTDKDTDGCILIGYSASIFGKANIGYSAQAFKDIYRKIYKEVKSGKKVVLTVERDIK